jgi:hypothetical protein
MNARLSSKHTLQLQRELTTAQQVINDLVRENYELKGLLTNAATHAQSSEKRHDGPTRQ